MENKEMNELLERVVASLTDEQKEQARACESLDKLIALLGKLGVELPDELLDDVGGGFDSGSFFNRPQATPVFGSALFKGTGSSGSVSASHLDLKGSPSVTAEHTDVSAEPKKGGTTRYI